MTMAFLLFGWMVSASGPGSIPVIRDVRHELALQKVSLDDEPEPLAWRIQLSIEADQFRAGDPVRLKIVYDYRGNENAAILEEDGVIPLPTRFEIRRNGEPVPCEELDEHQFFFLRYPSGGGHISRIYPNERRECEVELNALHPFELEGDYEVVVDVAITQYRRRGRRFFAESKRASYRSNTVRFFVAERPLPGILRHNTDAPLLDRPS